MNVFALLAFVFSLAISNTGELKNENSMQDAISSGQDSHASSLINKAPAERSIDWDIQDTPYCETEFVLNGIIYGFDGTVSLETDAIGFTIASSCLSSDAQSVQYVISLESGEGRLSGRLIDAVYDYSFYVYGLKTEYGVFLNTTSFEEAEYVYNLYKFTQNNASSGEYDDYLRNAFGQGGTYVSENEPSYAPNPSGVSLDYVYGYLYWKDKHGNKRALRGIQVDLCAGKDSIVVRSTTRTNDEGYYAFPAPEDPNGCHHLRIRAASDGFRIFMAVFDPFGWFYPTESFDGRGCRRDYTISIVNSNGSTNYLAAAFEISQALYYGVKYVKEMSNSTPKDVSVFFPYGENNGAFYSSMSGIHLGLYIYEYWDVILHEYGHRLQEIYHINEQPHGINHSLNSYAAAADKPGAVRLAWGEAWPTFFSNIVTKFYSNEIDNVQYTNDDFYDSVDDKGENWEYGIENDGNVYNLKAGECCEGNVIHVLYDMFDDNCDEPFDCLSLGDETMWDLVVNSKAVTFSAFVKYCYKDYRVEQDSLGKILSHYGMATPFIEITNLTSSYRDVPTIHWGVCNKNYSPGSDYPSDRYTLQVIDWGTHVLIEKDIGNNLSYTFSPVEWNAILLSPSTDFGVCVVSYQTRDWQTGGYASEIVRWQKPKKDFEARFSYKTKQRVVETLIEDLGPSSKANVYISFDTAGYKFFTTAGAEDTKMRLYSPTGALLQEDDDSGYSTNAMIVRYIAKSTSYYRLEITRYNPSSNLPFRLLVCASCPDLVEPGWSFHSIDELNAASGSLEVGAYGVANYVCLMRFTPKKSGTLTVDLESAFDNYLYVIDLSSPQSMFGRSGLDREYDDDGGNGSNAKLEKDVKWSRTYLVCYSQYNPSSEIGGDGFSADLKLTFSL